MRNLADILEGSHILKKQGDSETVIENIQFDSRKVGSNDVFVAIKGTAIDGHQYIADVIQRGVKAIVCEQWPSSVENAATSTIIRVDDTRHVLGIMAANYYDHPSDKITLVGVTGTNGKTTTVTLLFNLFRELGYNCGMLSTIENRINEEALPATHTTGDPVQINALLAEMVRKKVTHCFAEISSHAIDQKRISGLNFDGAIFTNLSQDHLDYHKNFRAYLNAKKAFFDPLPAKAWALVNRDDRNGTVMLQNTRASTYGYALKTNTDFKGKITEHHIGGLNMEIDRKQIWFGMVGTFNAYNLLATYAAAILLGENTDETLTAMSQLKGAEGRFDATIFPAGVTGIVDYAHTPDALKNVLETINQSRSFNESLITVIGAGGDRDKTKRPAMGRIAATLSDKVIITSDNPRKEKPQAIIDDILAGIGKKHEKKIITIPAREEAIKTACVMAREKDIILVAGKGHEKYQEVHGVRHHFDDKEILSKYLK